MCPPSLVRLGIAVSGALCLSLLHAPDAQAAPSAKRHARFVSRAMCAATKPLRLLHRPAHEWLERGRHEPWRGTDAAALQGSTPALHAPDDLLPASLEPLGVLASPRGPVPIGGTVARRSPRGPPASPGPV